SFGDGNFPRTSSTVTVISVCSRTTMVAATVQPEAMSVKTKLWAWLPATDFPQWATIFIFEEARRRIIPTIERPHGNASSQRSVDRRPPPSLLAVLPNQCQPPIHRRSAHGGQEPTYFCFQLQMSVPLHSHHQRRDRLLQPLTADPICRFPEN